jgi:predicted phosphodiesterase
MRVIVKTIEHNSRSDVFRIWPLGDVHWGARACDEGLFRKTVAQIKANNDFWIGMGDMTECITRRDKRHQEDVLAPWLWGHGPVLSLQQESLVEEVKPIGSQCLAYLEGNHELAVEEDGTDMYLSVVKAIRATESTDLHMGMSGFLVLKFRRTDTDRKGGTSTFTFYLHHGFGGGDLMSGPAIKLERLAESYSADIYMMGHTHKQIVFATEVFSATRSGALQAEKRYHINTGTFLKSNLPEATTYSERFGKKPVVLGPVMIELRPGAEDPLERVRVIH